MVSRLFGKLDVSRQRMLGGDGQEAHPEQRVWPRGEHLHLVEARLLLGQPEAHPRALAATDPVGLHRLHPVRPALQRAERLQQLIANHARLTGSTKAQAILDDWAGFLPKFRKVMPVEYRRALEEMARRQVLDTTGLGELEIGLRAGANGK